ncbi:MAG: hypothetical protein R3272_15340, partial [Candidatus Promineifilaceae bacterium]|nr:hypothetical protein [Candidatus Promineifilaceae bacterium]
MAAEEQERNILEYSLLHRLMVGFHAPVRWPVWLVIAAGALLASSVAAVWGRLSRRHDALAVAAFHFLFFVADTF